MASKKPKLDPDCGGIEPIPALTRKEFNAIMKKKKGGKPTKKTRGK